MDQWNSHCKCVIGVAYNDVRLVQKSVFGRNVGQSHFIGLHHKPFFMKGIGDDQVFVFVRFDRYNQWFFFQNDIVLHRIFQKHLQCQRRQKMFFIVARNPDVQRNSFGIARFNK